MAMEASLSKNRPHIPTHMSDESSPFILRTDHQNHEMGIGLEEPVKYTLTTGREPSQERQINEIAQKDQEMQR